jgi:uncharacterized membrane protein YeaQ/YmgE (transglycosylase-associated protein family)
MGGWALATLIGGGLLIGIIAQFIGDTTSGWEWLPVALAAVVGGWIGSESLGSASTWGPVMQDLYMLPALIGGIVLGGVLDVVTRYATGGHYVHAPHPV